jgi:hypothetical protein
MTMVASSAVGQLLTPRFLTLHVLDMQHGLAAGV